MSFRSLFTPALLAAVLLATGVSLISWTQPLAAQDKSAGERMDDGWLHTKVKSALATSRGASINIEVYKGEVQLAGFTTTPELAQSLPERASRVSGVKKVYNQIIVAEPDRSAGEVIDDGLLVSSVEAAMANDEFAKAVDINTESNRGTVLLSGFIDSEEQRQSVLEIVRTVKGVVKVLDGMNLKSDV